mgnify:CR=1 FL=1|tara:strand:+ start:38963 stop:40543 length:1581 start_codon:yes stop_codon:yes gene_type:complete
MQDTLTTERPDVDSRLMSVLLVEDDDGDARLIEACFGKRRRDGHALCRAKTLAAAVEMLGREDVDVILLDLGLPDGVGPGNVEHIAQVCDVPIVVLTGVDDEPTAVSAVQMGAQDYLIKGEFTTRGLFDSLTFATERQRRLTAVTTASRQENEIKDRFLSHVSHELRTPLTAIMQFVTILGDGIAGDLNEQQAEFVGIIHRNAEQLKHMISTLMDSTRASSGKLSYNPARVDLGEIVHATMDKFMPVAEAAGVHLDVESVDWPGVVADPHRIEQVVTNLVDNAIKFTPAEGNVTIGLRQDASDPERIVFTVRDTGCGLDAEAVEQVFDRLYQTDGQNDVCRKGLGLGLHISREIVAMHGGKIWVESSPGAGSCFQFSLQGYSLAPFVRRAALVDGALEQHIAVIRVCVRAVSGVAMAKGVNSVTDSVRSLLSGCLFGCSDEVLPHQVTREQAAFAVIARTDEVGAKAIEGRFRVGFDRQSELAQSGFACDVEVRGFELDREACDAQATLHTLVSQVEGFFGREIEG